MNLGMPEMIFIFLLALLLFGPKKLPQIGRELGKALNEFKRASNEFKNQLETEIEQAEASERDKSSGEPPQQEPAETADAGVPAATAEPADACLSTADATAMPAAEPKILPPAEPTVASSFGQSTIPCAPANTLAGNHDEHDQGGKVPLEAIAQVPAPLTGVNAGSFDKTTARDSNA
ncbi:MAG: TatA/E family twin arginine-targeting protein translocase [Candidatus Korobacteraceae bacterium]